MNIKVLVYIPCPYPGSLGFWARPCRGIQRHKAETPSAAPSLSHPDHHRHLLCSSGYVHWSGNSESEFPKLETNTNYLRLLKVLWPKFSVSVLCLCCRSIDLPPKCIYCCHERIDVHDLHRLSIIYWRMCVHTQMDKTPSYLTTLCCFIRNARYTVCTGASTISPAVIQGDK